MQNFSSLASKLREQFDVTNFGLHASPFLYMRAWLKSKAVKILNFFTRFAHGG